MSDIHWEKIPVNKRKQITAKLADAAGKIIRTNLTKPARTSLTTKFKFYAVRMMQTKLGKDDPEYADYKYWKVNGWIGAERPWK